MPPTLPAAEPHLPAALMPSALIAAYLAPTPTHLAPMLTAAAAPGIAPAIAARAPKGTRGGPVILHDRRAARDPFATWEGVILTRAWPAEMPHEDYLALALGGVSLRRVRRPDDVARHGAPVYFIGEAARRRARRLLDARCLNGAEAHNIACNAGRTATLNYLANTTPAGVQYFAVGTGSVPAGATGPVASDTSLWGEVFRKAFTSAVISGAQVDIDTQFATTDGNYTYTECGLFGNGATSSAGSGSLFAHALYAYQKTSSITLTNDYYVYLN